MYKKNIYKLYDFANMCDLPEKKLYMTTSVVYFYNII